MGYFIRISSLSLYVILLLLLRLGKKRANEIIRLKGKEIIFRVCVSPHCKFPPGVAMKR